ncbi:MAG TPA: type II toxin-antitoxin system PemK/MazF family toxin [Verrucomicrobiae bacterium]|jgi:mRNA interferase MazF
MIPNAGETWFVDFGMAAKPRWAFIVGSARDGRLALASVVKITTEYAGTPYEIALPRVPWLREQSYINAQSIQPVKYVELTRKAPSQFDPRILTEMRAALKRWLRL